MEKQKFTNEQFITLVDKNCEKIEDVKGTISGMYYIIKNAKDTELIETMNEIINEYVKLYSKDNKVYISVKDMPNKLALKILEKEQRMKNEKNVKPLKRYKVKTKEWEYQL